CHERAATDPRESLARSYASIPECKRLPSRKHKWRLHQGHKRSRHTELKLTPDHVEFGLLLGRHRKQRRKDLPGRPKMETGAIREPDDIARLDLSTERHRKAKHSSASWARSAPPPVIARRSSSCLTARSLMKSTRISRRRT